MKEQLQILLEGYTLSTEEAYTVLSRIGRGEINASQISAFITIYRMRPIRIEELIGFRQALLEMCLSVDLTAYNTVDIVGTGGDGKNTFNISTLACFVVSGAGIAVTKHGNYGVSSISGSSNVLEYLGVRFTSHPDALTRQVEQANFCMLHAPLFHPALKNVGPVRKELGIKTLFNILGPLVNPANPTHHVLGTYNTDLQRLYTYLHQSLQSSFVIAHSLDGYDEVSLTGPFKLTGNKLEHIYHPTDIGCPTYTEKELWGGDTIAQAADIFMSVLEGKGTLAQKDVVQANAAVAIRCVKGGTWEEALAMAKASLESGKALHSFKTFVSLTQL
ncbi:MAG: anthranilate phosphoribosyltransferase [Cytophagaceae bacterium]|jgi:anthranilate phosphoribosyltransferase|nr:anthranilate phosphoribosyltransferase [Cytophagaceae bacterium]